jgi:uncharacterized membrane protein
MNSVRVIPIDALWTAYAVSAPIVLGLLWRLWRAARHKPNFELWQAFMAIVASIALTPTFLKADGWDIIVPLPAIYVTYYPLARNPQDAWRAALCYGAFPILLVAGALWGILLALTRKQRAILRQRKNA